MKLSDYSLRVVDIDGRGCALQPISECIINGRNYTCDPGETDEEKIYIPVNELKYGCPICFPKQKKAYAAKVELFFWKWYVTLWELPYHEDAIYTEQEVRSIINNCRSIFDTPMRKEFRNGIA